MNRLAILDPVEIRSTAESEGRNLPFQETIATIVDLLGDARLVVLGNGGLRLRPATSARELAVEIVTLMVARLVPKSTDAEIFDVTTAGPQPRRRP